MNCTSEEESVTHHSNFDPPCTEVSSKCSNGTSIITNGIDHITDIESSKCAMVNGHASTTEIRPELDESYIEEEKSSVVSESIESKTPPICQDDLHCDKFTPNEPLKCMDIVCDDINSEINPKCPENTINNTASLDSPQNCDNINKVVPICGENSPNFEEKSFNCNENNSNCTLNSGESKSNLQTETKCYQEYTENGCKDTLNSEKNSLNDTHNFDKNYSENNCKTSCDLNNKEEKSTSNHDTSNCIVIPEESIQNDTQSSEEITTDIEETSEVQVADIEQIPEEKCETENCPEVTSVLSEQKLEPNYNQSTEETKICEQEESSKPEENIVNPEENGEISNLTEECNSKNNCESSSSQLNSTDFCESNENEGKSDIVDKISEENQSNNSETKQESENESHSSDSEKINGEILEKVISSENLIEKSEENQLEEKLSEEEHVSENISDCSENLNEKSEEKLSEEENVSENISDCSENLNEKSEGNQLKEKLSEEENISENISDYSENLDEKSDKTQLEEKLSGEENVSENKSDCSEKLTEKSDKNQLEEKLSGEENVSENISDGSENLIEKSEENQLKEKLSEEENVTENTSDCSNSENVITIIEIIPVPSEVTESSTENGEMVEKELQPESETAVVDKEGEKLAEKEENNRVEKSLPESIINDVIPEIEETETVNLIPSSKEDTSEKTQEKIDLNLVSECENQPEKSVENSSLNLVSECKNQPEESVENSSFTDNKESESKDVQESPGETSMEDKDLLSESEKSKEDCNESEELNTSGESVATSSSTDKTALLKQTKPFHIPLDDAEVIQYLKKQVPKFGRPRKRRRDNTNAMMALEALRSKGWKPGRRAKGKEEEKDTSEEMKDASEEVPKVKRKYNKRKASITEIDLSPRKLRRVPARLALDSELRQIAARTPNPESPKTPKISTPIKGNSTPVAPEMVDLSTIMSDSSMENIDPLATDASLDVPETCGEMIEDNLDTGTVKIVDPTQFLISQEPVKKKLGRPRKDSTPIIPISTSRVTRNIKRPIVINVKRKYTKKSDLKNECDKKKVNDLDLSKSSIESTSSTPTKKKMGRPRKIITDDEVPISPKRKYIKKKYPDGSPKQLGPKKYITKMIKNQGHFKCTKEALKKLKLKSCHVVLERKVARAKKILADVKEKKKIGRPKKIRDESEEPKKLGRPRKSDSEKGSPEMKKPRKSKSMSPEDGKIKKKMGRPKKLSLTEDTRVSPIKLENIKQEVDNETEDFGPGTVEGMPQEKTEEETKPCKILLDSSKVTKYLTTQKKRKREETHAEIIHKRFKAEMERLQNLAADQELRPAPPSKTKKSYVTCEICQKTFVNDNQYRLNRHMAAVHNSEPFCKRCNTMFKDRTGFYSHVKRCKIMYGKGSPLKSGEVPIPREPPPPLPPPNPEDLKPGLYCPYCYKTFCSKFSTERHMRIMHPEKIFCKFCLEPFQDISEYPDHLLGCPERPKRDGKLVKIKKEIAKKLGTLVGKPLTTPIINKPNNNSTVVVNTSSFTNSIEFDSFNNSSNEKNYGYTEFYSDMEVSSTSYSLDNSYSQHHEQWDESKTSEWGEQETHDEEIEVTQEQQQQNLAMLEFMPAVNEPEFDYVHSESIQHVEDDKVYHML